MSNDSSECFGSCNTAYRIGQFIGRSEILCDPDGDFMNAYNACATCIDAKGPDVLEAVPELIDLLATCRIGIVYSTIEHFLSDGTRTTETIFVEAPTSPVDASTTTPGSSSISQIRTTSGGPPAETGADGGADIPDSGSNSKAWIAGPVVGGVACLVLVLGLVFWLWKRHEGAATIAKADEHLDKPQLHGDSLPHPKPVLGELHPDSIHEMEGSVYQLSTVSLPKQLLEKPANEHVAYEMATRDERREELEHVAGSTAQRRDSRSLIPKDNRQRL